MRLRGTGPHAIKVWLIRDNSSTMPVALVGGEHVVVNVVSSYKRLGGKMVVSYANLKEVNFRVGSMMPTLSHIAGHVFESWL